MLSNRIGDYWYISQGKTRIPGVNDAADMEETDVSPTPGCAKKSRPTFHVAFHLPFPLLLLLLPFSAPPSPRIEGGRWKKLGRGFRHPLAPRLRKLAAAAIGVRGDWGRKGIGRIGFEMRKDSNPHGTRSPISSDSLFLSRQHFSRLVLHQIFVRTENRSIRSVYVYITISSFNRKLFFFSIYVSVFLFFFFLRKSNAYPRCDIYNIYFLRNVSQTCVSCPTTYTIMLTYLKEKSRSPTSTMARNVY